MSTKKKTLTIWWFTWVKISVYESFRYSATIKLEVERDLKKIIEKNSLNIWDIKILSEPCCTELPKSVN